MLNTREAFANLSNTWKVPAALPYFQGHFPGNPIFPAVAIVDASLALIRKTRSNDKLALLGMSSSKFVNPIRPEQEVQIELNELSDGLFEAVWRTGDTLLVTLQLVVGEDRS